MDGDFFMKHKAIAPVLLLGLALWFWTGVLTVREQAALSEKLLRLHVVAASDSETDQAKVSRLQHHALSRPQVDPVGFSIDIAQRLDLIRQITNLNCFSFHHDSSHRTTCPFFSVDFRSIRR